MNTATSFPIMENSLSNIITQLLKGESLPFIFDRDGKSIAGWICNISVKKFQSDGPNDYGIAPREIPSVDNVWPGFLTSTEIDSLTENGTFRLIGLLTNSSTDEQEQVPLRFYIGPSWAS